MKKTSTAKTPASKSRKSVKSSKSVKKSPAVSKWVAEKTGSKAIALAYDLGGTKVTVGVVDSSGKILAFEREVAQVKLGKKATLSQMTRMGKAMIAKYPSITHVGIASAGPLDPVEGVLLDPTNFNRGGESWGRTPIAAVLAKGLKKTVILENDAAAAILAEVWKGLPKGTKNALILTLGTGLGTAAVANGELVRGGQNQHTEGGHMIIRAGDQSAPCGCGMFGCAEAYLSGRSFAHRGRKVLGNDIIDAPQIAGRAREGDAAALALFEEYSELLAVALHNYIMYFYPEVIVFTGSFAAAHDLFLKNAEKKLAKMLTRRNKVMNLQPKLVISKLENQAGLLGGAYVAFRAMGIF